MNLEMPKQSGAPETNESLEAPRKTEIVGYDRADIEEWEKEGIDYPHRDLVRILINERLPAVRGLSLIEKARGAKKERRTVIDGVVRKVVPTGIVYEGEYGVVGKESIESTEMLSDILIAKGIGPCYFMIGLKDGRGFIMHNTAGFLLPSDFAELMHSFGVENSDPEAEIIVGGGMTGAKSSGQTGARKKSLLNAAQAYGLTVKMLDIKSDASSPDWDTTSVAVDPTTKFVLILRSGTRPMQEAA